MSKAHRFAMGAIAVTVLSMGGVTLAQEWSFPWDRVVGFDTSTFDDPTRSQFIELTRATPNYHGCRGNVLQCLSTDPPDRTAQRLAGFLARRLVAGDSVAAIEQAVAERRRSVHPREVATIDVEGAQCIGAESPLVTVVEFADFECPFCKVASPILERLVSERAEQVRFCFKFFPLRTHARAVPTALASLAAAAQGRFWEMHDCLYEHAPDLSDAVIEGCVQSIGLDQGRFRQDVADEALLEEVMADKMEGQALLVDRTPTIFVNGKNYFGELSEIELADRIDEELDLLQPPGL